jgi:uncharacterized Fe-S center protein
MDGIHHVPAQISGVAKEGTLLHAFRALLDRLRPEEAFGPRDKIAVKMSVGGADSYTTVHPQFVRTLVDRFRDRDNFLYVVDEHRLVRTAHERGYTRETLHAPVYPISGVVDRYHEVRQITDSPYFDRILVAGTIAHADGLIVVSHAKGHATCGFGGALKNLGIGCVSQSTRNHIHTFEGHDGWKQEVAAAADAPHQALSAAADRGRPFSRALARSAAEVLAGFPPEKVLCLDVALNIHPYCDCWGLSSPSVVHDLGLFLGRDPADVDEAVLGAVAEAPFARHALPPFLDPVTAEETESGHIFERIHGKNPFVQVEEFRRLRAAAGSSPDR